ADALVGWLGEHAGTEALCRDPDVYANAARRGAPGAVQVADRWHLPHNLAQALERFSGRELAMLRPAGIGEHATAPTAPYPPPPRPGRSSHDGSSAAACRSPRAAQTRSEPCRNRSSAEFEMGDGQQVCAGSKCGTANPLLSIQAQARSIPTFS